ncbi:MAG: hypothetical protein ACQERK_04700 [Campylobacterota bacterium]
MALHYQYEDMYNVIKHHVSLAKRYKDTPLRHFSIAFLSIHDKHRIDIEDMITHTLRDTDIVFDREQFFIIFMPATEYSGADMLIKELCQYLGQKRKDTIVSYPRDGANAVEIIGEFENKIQSDYGVIL